MAWNFGTEPGVKGPFVTRGDLGAGGGKCTPECSEQATGQDATERCCEEPPHSALVVSHPELFCGAILTADLAARLC